MATSSDEFFKEYANCFAVNDAQQASNFYFLPTVIMNDTEKSVFSQKAELVQRISNLMDSLTQVGVVHYIAEVCQTMRLSDNILFSNVKWRFHDAQDKKVFGCFTSYTLQKQDNGELRIIVSVIDDEEKELAKLLQR